MKLKILIIVVLSILIIGSPIRKELQAQNSDIKVVCCNGVPLFSKPNMRSRTRIRLRRGEKVQQIGKTIKRGRRSFDFSPVSYKGKRYYIPFEYLTQLPPAGQYGKKGNLVIGTEEVDKWVSLPLNYSPNDLVTIPKQYRAPGYKWRKMQLRREAYLAFKRMMNDANRQGITIRFVSCFRSASYQEGPYKRNMRINPKQKASAKPGHSEHQLGTAADVSSRSAGWKLSQRFFYTKEYKWIKRNARKYGIYVSYPKGTRKGYIWEPWHLRYWGENVKFNSYHSPE